MINVVFDTNAYRNTVRTLYGGTLPLRVKTLRTQEAGKGYRALASITVMLELLTHMADPTDPHRDECGKALAFLVSHCRIDDSEDSMIAFLPPGELAICKALFDRVPDGSQAWLQQVVSQSKAVANNYLSETELSGTSSDIDTFVIADFVQDSEERFKQDFMLMISMIDPGCGTTKIDIADTAIRRKLLRFIRSDEMLGAMAGAYVDKAADSLGATLDAASRSLLVDKAMSRFTVPLEIYRQMLERTVTSGLDMEHPKKGRTNSLWDMDIVAFGGTGNTIDGAEILLVTNEKMIREAYAQSGVPHLVCSLEEYMGRLNV